MMLAGGKYRSIVASTLPEIRGALPLVEEGILDEVTTAPFSYGETGYSTCGC
jgi:hypothetical protein